MKVKSCWSANDISLTIGNWAAFPKAGISSLLPRRPLPENAEIVAGLPTFFAPAARVLSFLNSAGTPPPLPLQLMPSSPGGTPRQLVGVTQELRPRLGKAMGRDKGAPATANTGIPVFAAAAVCQANELYQ